MRATKPARSRCGPTKVCAAGAHSSRRRRLTKIRHSVRKIASLIRRIWSARNVTFKAVNTAARPRSPPSARKCAEIDAPGRRDGIAEITGMRLGTTIVASTNEVQTSAGWIGRVQPSAKATTAVGAERVRRRLSIIFQRPIRGSSPLTLGAPSPLPAKPRIQGRSCQSPRAQR